MRVESNRTGVARAVRRGLSTFAAIEPMTLREWAEKNFYLSAESSQVEQRWEAWPFQRAILACIGSDDVHEVDVIKSARVGYTKILLAAVGYFAEHRRRNQVLWQPTDDGRDEFVKTEVDPMIRDVRALHPIFPARQARHKDNTLRVKKFLGSTLHLRGGRSADNYRRLTVSVGFLDEFSSFEPNIDGEGDPGQLAAKRVEGATFPKLVFGSTPKLKESCLMEKRAAGAKARYEYRIFCPHCDGAHAITWGGKDEPHGLKWIDRDPDSVRHLCTHCGVLITQGEYLAVAGHGFWLGDDGSTIDHDGVFRDADGEIILAHRHVAFHVWAGYSPMASWTGIVQDFLKAFDKAEQGDNQGLKTFYNTTLGRAWEGEIEKIEADELKRRAGLEMLRLPGRDENVVPRRCLLLLAGCDTQDNRIEVAVWGFGPGGEMWTIDHQVFFGDPNSDELQGAVAKYLFERRFQHECGQQMAIYATAIDTGGHNTHAIYEFARRHKPQRVFAVRGRPLGEKHIKDGAGQVDIDWRGKRTKKGVILWHVGTNMAKDLLHSRLQVEKVGPGYVHLAHDLSDEWFRQFSGEVRAVRRSAPGRQTRWSRIRTRVEALDCAVYALWLEVHLNLARKTDAWWEAMERKLDASPPPGAEHTEDDGPTPPLPSPTNIPAPAPAGVVASGVKKQTAARPARRTTASSYLRGRR